MLRLDEPLKEGLLLLGTAAGAPFLPKLAELAKGNLPFAVGIMALLTLGTVGYLPLVLPLLLSDVTVDSAKIARWLSLLMLLPLAAGLALKAYRPGVAARVKPFFDGICGVSLIPLVLLLAFANVDKIYQIFGTRGILAGLLLIHGRLWYSVVAWGTWCCYQTGAGPRHWTAQYCRRARGGE